MATPAKKLLELLCYKCGTQLERRWEDWKQAELAYCPKCKLSIYPGCESMFSNPILHNTLFVEEPTFKRRRR